MGKRGLKKKDWLYVMLGFILFVPTAMVIGVAIYARLNPWGSNAVPEAEDSSPEFATTPDGALDRVDSGLSLESMDPDRPAFSQWRGSRLILFYFSARCTHCKKAFPSLQAMADSLRPIGIRTIALAIKSNSHPEIQEFAEEQKSRLQMYHDEERRFGNRTGMRNVPSVALVDTNGSYLILPGFDAATPRRIRRAFEMMSASHPAINSP